jgi:predicted dehydrogenase
MDYTTQPILFQVNKAVRYLNLYGPSRTYRKIRSQFHMKSTEAFTDDTWTNPKGQDVGNIAIVGCGNFSFSTIAYYISKKPGAKIKYALDIHSARAKSLAKEYNVYQATSDFQHILADKNIKLIYIASNHASHAEYAIEAIEAGKAVHIEKPHAVSEEQLRRLVSTMEKHPNVPVFLGFNRPKSTLFTALKAKMDAEPGTSMLNWFISGHAIEDDHWYFSEAEGGRILGNLCHWSDLCIHLVGMDNAFPCTISPALAPEDKSNFALSITFNDGSQASLTFSAKGHTFEGVREYLNVHKGDLLGSLSDFHHLRTDVGHRKSITNLTFRDHGHKANIWNSFSRTCGPEQQGESISYVLGTGLLVLKIKEAFESGKAVTCDIGPTATKH